MAESGYPPQVGSLCQQLDNLGPGGELGSVEVDSESQNPVAHNWKRKSGKRGRGYGDNLFSLPAQTR